MAAEESSQGAALGPDFSEPEGDRPPADPEFPDMQDVRGDFLTALCVLEMVCLALEGEVEGPPRDIGSFALALRHGVELVNAAYERFDLGLVGLPESGASLNNATDGDAGKPDLDSEIRLDHAEGAFDGRAGLETAEPDVAMDHGIASGPSLYIDPEYEAVILAQTQGLMDVSSSLSCVMHTLTNGPDEVEAAGALTVTREALLKIVERLQSLTLRARSARWLESRGAAEAH